MSASASPAVFLSYASEDATTARRIRESLREAGIEVWFDQSELVGGDTWDRKIRDQITTCALFVPVISAHTQARLEGYFRLEWKLAAQRTHTMADEKAFLLPVVIDTTRDADAKVPVEFKAVQWTRLPGGETNAAFCARVIQLLGGAAVGRVSDPPSESLPRERAGQRPALPPPSHALLRSLIALGVVALVALALWQPWKSSPTQPPVAAQPPLDLSATGSAKGDKSIAVLPFENRSAEKDSAFFSEGVHEEILTNLAQIRELRVVSRTSVMEYRGTTKKMPQIARELGVAYLLEGSVQRAGGKVRVTGQLIRAATDEHVWAQSYDRDTTDIFAIQAELARAIAGALQAKLSPQEQNLIARRPTENLAAYDLYLKSREFENKGLRNRTDYEARESLLQSAVKLDPKFAVAWGELAEAHVNIRVASFDTTPARLAKARAAIEQALALAPDSPTVIRSLGVYYAFGGIDSAKAIEQFEKLVRLQPNDAESHHWLGLSQFGRGQFAEGIVNRRKAAILDPANPNLAANVVATFRLIRRYDDAIAEQRRLMALRPGRSGDEFELAFLHFRATGSPLELEALLARREANDPNSPDTIRLRKRQAFFRGNYAEFFRLDRLHPDVGALQGFTSGLIDDAAFSAALVYLTQGDRDGARERLGKIPSIMRAQLELEPENTQLLRAGATVEAILGNKEEALRRIEKAAELAPEATNKFIGVSISVFRAEVLAILGEKDRALAELARLLRAPSNLNVHVMQSMPQYFQLRGDPRFEALLNDPKNNAPLF